MLTIFLHNKRPAVDIVRWFKDPKFGLNWASGPVTEMSTAEFRKRGYTFAVRHFKEYAKIRLDEKDDVFACTPVDAKKWMDDSDVVSIGCRENQWLFLPEVVRRNSFPRGIEGLEPDKRRTTPANCRKDIFWRTFDEVYAFTHWYSV